MKRLTTISALLLAAIVPTTTATADQPKHVNPACTAAQFAEFSANVWHLPGWEKKAPAPSTLAAQKRKLSCAGPGHRKAMKHRWRADKHAFYVHRGNMLFIQRVTPYYGCTSIGGCKWWALPVYIVDCESGGDYYPDWGLSFGGAYGILVSTWQQWGGGAYSGAANEATPKQQDKIARQVWLDVGPSGWECA